MTSTKPADGWATFTLKQAIEMSRGRSVIPSGSETIDEILSGGYRASEIVEIFGASKTGKTQLAMQAAVSCASMKKGVLFVDTEGTFRPERMEAMARARGLESREILQRVYRMRAPDAQTQFEALKTVNSRRELWDCRLFVVDTLTKNLTVQYPGTTNLPKRQGLLNAYLSELARDAFLSERAVLLTNRVTSFRTATGSKETHVGGETLNQLVHRTIHLTRRGERVRAALLVRGIPVKTAEGVITERGFG